VRSAASFRKRSGGGVTTPASTRARSVAAALFAASLLGACTVGPDFARPDLNLPATYSAAPALGQADLAGWWTRSADPDLGRLVDEALRGNLDLQIATARIREARALRRQAQSSFVPQVDFDASATRSRSVLQTGRQPQTVTGNLFDVGFDATWEIDLFGGIRRGVEAATASLQSVEEERRDTFVTLAAEVARNYLELRGAQQRLAVAEANLAAQQETVRLTRVRFEAGAVSNVDVQRALAQAANTAAQLPPLRASIKASIHRLGVLLGREPGALATELSTPKALPAIALEPGAGAPADLLRRRPDVRAAERRLAAATAEIGVAEADLLPRLSLTGAIGTVATAGSDLFTDRSSTWSIGGLLGLPIFDGGRRRAEVEVQRAQADQALGTYRATVLEALEEVENAFVAVSEERRRLSELDAAYRAQARAAQLARDLYADGQGSFLDVLDAERQLFQAQDARTTSETAVATGLVTIFKALGGGWETTFPEPARQSGAAGT
jgi:multidrug efflux system outer membrane protein